LTISAYRRKIAGMNEAASQLGQLAAGVPKNFSQAERQRRKQQMTELNRKRALARKIAGNAHQKRKAQRAAK
jgi:hypothetical protein